MTYAKQTRGRIRVLHVVTRLNLGGPAHQLGILVPQLNRLGFDPKVVAGTLPPGESVHPWAHEQLAPYLLEPIALHRAPKPLADLRATLALHRLCRRWKPHVVHTHTSKAGVVGRIAAASAGVPAIVHTYHGHVLQHYYGPLASGTIRIVERALAQLSSACVVLSPAQRADLVHRFRVVPRHKAVVIAPAVDERALAHAPPTCAVRERFNLPPAAPLIGFCGRLTPIKALGDLLTACTYPPLRSRGTQLVIAGCGQERECLERQARELRIGDHVHFLGAVDSPASLYAQLDVLALPSHSEGLPLVVLEASLFGVPVVASAVGGLVDLLESHSNLTLVPAASPERLGQALARALQPIQAKASLPPLPARFSPERLVNSTAALYRRLLQRGTLGKRNTMQCGSS